MALRLVGPERRAVKIRPKIALQRFSHAHRKDPGLRQLQILDGRHIPRGKNPGMA